MEEKMSYTELFAEIDKLNEKYLKVWEDICNLESPTNCKEGVDAVGRYIAELSEKLGRKIEIIPEPVSGDVVFITMNPDVKGKPIALSGHIDTVHPVGSFGTPAVTWDSEKIYGPGVTDCKGGVVACLLAMEALEKIGFDARPVMLLLQTDEETSSLGSKKNTIHNICEKAKDCEAFLNCEGFHNITLIRKGIARYIFEVKGKSGHASGCHLLSSAIREAAAKILEIEKFKDGEGITANVGVISGGTVINAVPETCTFKVDVRFGTQKQFEEADAKMREIANTSFFPDTSCTLSQPGKRDAMELCERNLTLLDNMNRVFAESGLPAVKYGKSGGGSDAADVTVYGIPCVDSMGVRGGNLHSRDEYAYISSLAESAKRIAAVVYGL